MVRFIFFSLEPRGRNARELDSPDPVAQTARRFLAPDGITKLCSRKRKTSADCLHQHSEG
jgi:hypothetical protein